MTDYEFSEAVRAQLRIIRYTTTSLTEYRGAIRIIELIWGDER